MEDQGWAWTRLTVSAKVTEGPAILGNMLLSANSSGAADATPYNGVDANGDQFITLKAATSRLQGYPGGANVRMEKGLYVEVGSNVEEVVVIWRPIW